MNRLRHPAPWMRRLLAVVLALVIGVWLAMPQGFMPASHNGTPAIVPCPGADGTIDIVQGARMAMPAMAMDGPGDHSHGAPDAFHHTCQYAAAASLAALGAGGIALPQPLVLASAPPVVAALATFHRRATRERPPAQGPPLPA